MVNKEQWLRRLEWSLTNLPLAHRQDIVQETQSHIEDRLSQGTSESDVLSSLGLPEDYAKEFNDAFALSFAVGEGRFGKMLEIAARKTHRSLRVTLAFITVLLLALILGSIVLTAIMHYINPAHWGLWMSPKMFLLGYVDNPSEATELLGAFIYVLAAVAVPICWGVGRAAVHRALRSLLTK